MLDRLLPLALLVALQNRLVGAGRAGRDRGDVPGWVLITLMTAGLVLVIWAVAGPALSGVFDQAISSVISGVTP